MRNDDSLNSNYHFPWKKKPEPQLKFHTLVSAYLPKVPCILFFTRKNRANVVNLLLENDDFCSFHFKKVQGFLPLSVHIEDDSLAGGGLDGGPEGVLVDLGDLADGDARRVQAGPDLAVPLPTDATTPAAAAQPHNRILVGVEAGSRRRRRAGEDLVLRGAGKRRRRANGLRRQSERLKGHFRRGW